MYYFGGMISVRVVHFLLSNASMKLDQTSKAALSFPPKLMRSTTWHKNRWRRGNRRDGWMSWARCVYPKKYWRLPAARRRNPLIIISLWMSSFLNRWQWISMENPRHYTGVFCIPWFDHHRDNLLPHDRTTAAMDAWVENAHPKAAKESCLFYFRSL